MLKLFTITGNLLAETTAVYEFPRQGSTVRAIGDSKFQVGGKGVNVARAATALGLPAFAAVFPAGFNGAKCVQMLKRDGVAAEVLPCDVVIDLDGLFADVAARHDEGTDAPARAGCEQQMLKRSQASV